MVAAHATASVPPPRPAESRSPEVLIVAVARGDERAFARLYDHLAGPIYGTVLAVVRSRPQAEEVTREVLLEIWRKAARFDPSRTAKVQTWALTIAHRRAIDRVRSERASRDRQDRAGLPDLRRPDDDALSTPDRTRVRDALGRLTDLQRETIQLAYFTGLTGPEVADRLGVAIGTVETRMRDGMIRLRDALGAR